MVAKAYMVQELVRSWYCSVVGFAAAAVLSALPWPTTLEALGNVMLLALLGLLSYRRFSGGPLLVHLQSFTTVASAHLLQQLHHVLVATTPHTCMVALYDVCCVHVASSCTA
jgi:hypothetical protein